MQIVTMKGQWMCVWHSALGWTNKLDRAENFSKQDSEVLIDHFYKHGIVASAVDNYKSVKAFALSGEAVI